MNTTIADLTELAGVLSDDEWPMIQIGLQVGEWRVDVYTRPILHEHVVHHDGDDGCQPFGIVRGRSPNLHTAINLAAAKARIVLASLEGSAA